MEASGRDGVCRIGATYLNARKLKVLHSHKQTLKSIARERPRVKVCQTWHLRQVKWVTVKKRTEEGTDMPVLHGNKEKLFVYNLVKLDRFVEAGWQPKDWPRYCRLLCPNHTLSLLDEPKVWCIATRFKRRHLVDSECPIFVWWRRRKFFLIPLEEGKRS